MIKDFEKTVSQVTKTWRCSHIDPLTQYLREMSRCYSVLQIQECKYAHGFILNNGDTVRVTKNLKVGSGVIGSGMKVESIRQLIEPVDTYDIAWPGERHGSFYLKCTVVKKET